MKRSLLIAGILCAVVLGCKLPASLTRSGSNASNSNGTTAASDNETSPAAPPSDPKAAVVQASTKFAALPFFTAHMDGEGDSVLHMKLEYATPDKYHLTYDSGLAAGTEMIIVGKQVFKKNRGNWTKFPGDMGSTIPKLRDQFTEEGIKRLSDVKYEGEDTADGKAAYLYSYKSSVPVNGSKFTSKIWVAKATGLPIQITADYVTGKLKQMTIKYDTETPVNIEAPIN